MDDRDNESGNVVNRTVVYSTRYPQATKFIISIVLLPPKLMLQRFLDTPVT